MGNFIDILIIIIILFMILEGYIKGLMRSVIGFFGYIFAFIMGKMYYLKMTKYLKNNFEWFNNLQSKISEGLISGVSKSTTEVATTTDFSSVLQSDQISQNPRLMNDFINSVNQFSNVTNTTEINLNFMKKSADTIADGIVNGIGFFCVVIACLLVVKIIGLILDVATEAPIIKQANKVGGVIFGALKAGVLIFVLMMIAMYIAPLFPELDIINTIYNSHIGVYFYEHNLLLLALHIFIKA